MTPQSNSNRGPRAGRAGFDTTRWSVVCRAGAAGTDDARRAVGELFERYWYPLYAFARRQGHDDHDAMDLSQGFFATLVDGQSFARVSQDRGRFRSFLLASFRHFIANQLRAARAVRRGGGATTLSLTGADFQARYEREPAEHETPESLFDRSWVESLLARVRERLADDYRAAGKAELLALLEPHLVGGADAVPRAEVGRALALSPTAVAMSLYRMRRRYGELLREEVANTVVDPADVEDELRSLMECVGRRG